MKDLLHHFFVPRESNNHRAKLLHHHSIFSLIIVLVVAQFFLTVLKTNFPEVLGTATNIAVSDLLSATNQKRQEQGLNALTLNEQLSQAAAAKAADMFSKNYWAHNAPDGTTPWVFIKNVGYTYVYAGENLARGFMNSSDVVSAWMASTSHRENMLSSNYNEIGFAVVSGNLLGEETVLVVEMFGSRSAPVLARREVQTPKTAPVATPIPTPLPTLVPTITSQPLPTSVPALTPIPKPELSLVAAVRTTPFINSNALSKNTALFILFLFIATFLLDMIIVERRKIVRIVGHNLDHTLFLAAIFLIIGIMSRGVIL